MANPYLDLSAEVAAAIHDRQPVLALESTIVAHGMPYPRNVETALAVERIVRDAGAVPATIAILGGRPTVGLSPEQIERIGKAGEGVTKASRRDIAVLVAEEADGATTVAATMIVAAWAGVRLFTTGGIGGVHRGAQETFDISADLEELARTNLAVICAGAKSILDIGLTLEYLETRGVPVLGFRTEEFPAFYTRSSGYTVDRRMDSAAQVARVLHAKWRMGLDGGVVVANPIPEQDQAHSDQIERAIEEALGEASRKGITGKRSTPFLLARIAELTGGESLEANIRLVKHNARVGAQIAVEYSRLERWR